MHCLTNLPSCDLTKPSSEYRYQLSSLGHFIVLYVAGYPTRLYGRLKSNGNGSSRESYHNAQALLRSPKGSLAPMHSRIYKSKIKPFA